MNEVFISFLEILVQQCCWKNKQIGITLFLHFCLYVDQPMHKMKILTVS